MTEVYNEEWLLDGRPTPEYRATVRRRNINTPNILLTSASMLVYAVPVQPGDIFGAITLMVKTATATPTHSWAALYNGVTAGAQLLAQTPDNAGGFAVGANHLLLPSPVPNVGMPGTWQGPGGPAVTPQGPAVWGVALYNSGATGASVDGVVGGSVAGEVAITGQAPLASSLALAATATAPANLAGIVAQAFSVAYVLLSRA